MVLGYDYRVVNYPMYRIEHTEFGLELTFGGRIDGEEMNEWLDDSEDALADTPDEFGVFVDMRTLQPLGDDARATMQRGQERYRDAGMVRSAVILDSPTTTLQFRRIAQESGIDEWERYVDASSTDNWREVGLNWVRYGKDPNAEVDGTVEEVVYHGETPIEGGLDVVYRSSGKHRRERWRGTPRIEPGDRYTTRLPVEHETRIFLQRDEDDRPFAAVDVE